MRRKQEVLLFLFLLFVQRCLLRLFLSHSLFPMQKKEGDHKEDETPTACVPWPRKKRMMWTSREERARWRDIGRKGHGAVSGGGACVGVVVVVAGAWADRTK